MRGPAYTDEENVYLRELVANTGLTLESRVEQFMRKSPEERFHLRTEDAVSQKLRKLMAPPGKRPSARAGFRTRESMGLPANPKPLRRVGGEAQARLEILGVTITGPEQNVLAVAKQLA